MLCLEERFCTGGGNPLVVCHGLHREDSFPGSHKKPKSFTFHEVTSRTDFRSACICMTFSAHSIRDSPRGTFTLSCLSRPTLNSPGSSRLTLLVVLVRSTVASRRFCSHTIALKHTTKILIYLDSG